MQCGGTKILFALLCLTAFSFFLIESAGLRWQVWASYAIIVVAVIKARLIILHFMEVRDAPPKWRLMYETWYVSIGLMLMIGEFASLSSL